MSSHVGVDAFAPARLVIRSPPLDRESPRGWYLRLSEMNDYGNPRWIVGRGSGEDMARRAAALTGYSSTRLSGHNSDTGVERSAKRYGIPVARRYMRVPCSALCPHCVAEDGVLLAEWDLAFWTVCPRHSCEMVRSCSCGRALSWDRPGVAVCANLRCGRDLRTIQTVQADEKTADLVACIGKTFRISHACQDGKMPSLLRASTFDQITATVRLLSRPWLASAQGIDPVLMRSADAVSIAADMLRDWPKGLQFKLAPQSANGFPGQIGAIRRLLTRTEKARIEEGFRSALLSALQDLLYDVPSGPTYPVLGVEADGPRLTLRHAASIVGLTEHDLAAMTIRGTLACTLPRRSGCSPTVSMAEAERAASGAFDTPAKGGSAVAQRFLNRRTAARLLGIGTLSVERLVQAGLLASVVDGKGIRLVRRSLEDLLTRSADRAEPHPGDGVDIGIDLVDVARGLTPLSLHQAIEHVLAGDCPIFEAHPAAHGLARFALSSTAVAQLGQSTSSVDVRTLIRLLKCQSRDPKRLVAAGLLTLACAGGESRTGRARICAASVRSFQEQYASTATLAVAGRRSCHSVSKWLAAQGVRPALNRCSENTTDFWRRSEALVGRGSRSEDPVRYS